MRKLGILLSCGALAVLFLHTPAASAKDTGKPAAEVKRAQEGPDAGPAVKEPVRKVARAMNPMSHLRKPGTKVGGSCDITCSDGYQDSVPWEGLDSCCDSCMQTCGEDCFAWENGGGTTTCYID
jgi:hypothetical protein